jgi:hypothetical protein
MDEKSLLEIKKTIIESLSFLKEEESFEAAANKAKKNWGGELEPEEEFSAEEFFGDAGDAAEEDIKDELGDNEFPQFGTLEDPERMMKDLEEDEEVGQKGLFKPQDSVGNDVNISSLVKHVDSEKTGRVLGFGDDGDGSLIVRVDWQFPTDMKFTDPEEMGEMREAPEHLIVQGLNESTEEEYVTVCGECGEEMGPDITSGDEGWSVCSECGAVEGPTEEIPLSDYKPRYEKKSKTKDMNEEINEEEVNEEICDTDASEGDELGETRAFSSKNSGDRNVKLRDDKHKAPLTNLNESVNNSIKNLLEGSVTKKTLKKFINEEAKKVAKNLRG